MANLVLDENLVEALRLDSIVAASSGTDSRFGLCAELDLLRLFPGSSKLSIRRSGCFRLRVLGARGGGGSISPGILVMPTKYSRKTG